MPPNSPPLDSSANPRGEPVPNTAVREQLVRLVNSPTFVSSPRLCRFLTFIVDKAIEGDLDNLKEFSIALEVFDRTSDYDPNIDAIVRVEARRLRAKLKAYYEDGPGTSDPVLIALRPGSYLPIFRRLDTKQTPEVEEIHLLPQPARTSIAVLPFLNMSPEPEQDYFCDGITEEIINSLTHIPGLDVIARTSAFQFKSVSIDIREVGQRLGADLLIEGSVRKAGQHLRITAQMIQTDSGHHVWSETFRRELKDVFAIQEEIAQCVADLLRLHFPVARPVAHSSARNVEAYTRYLKARFLIYQQSPETLRSALEILRELVKDFPDYGLGYSGIAAANAFLSVFGVVSGREVYPETKMVAARGYALDPESGETCTILAGILSAFEFSWDEVERLCERALKMQPGHAMAHMVRGMSLLRQGNISAAEASLRRSAELNPLSAPDYARMAYVHYLKGDNDLALDYLQNSFERDRDYHEARLYEGLLRFKRQEYDAVIDRMSCSLMPLELGLLAAAQARRRKRSRANEVLEQLVRLENTQYVTPLAYAFAAIGMEDLDLAFQRLEEAIDHKTSFVSVLAVEPFFDPLRGDARFAKLLNSLNLSNLALKQAN